MAHKLYDFYWRLYQPETILRATNNTIRGKKKRHDVQRLFEHGFIDTMQNVWELLQSESFKPSEYTEKVINDGKERHLKIAPLVPDRIVHHCIVDELEDFLIKIFSRSTYACVKGRGIHKCLTDLNKALQYDKRNTKYCLKIDIRHYYDNIDHGILKGIISKSIGDKRLLRLISTLIDSTEGVGIPIGFLTSQNFANWYLTPFDHWLKECKHVRYYYRYMDDIVILGRRKEDLSDLLEDMRAYLSDNLKLTIKQNWQIFPVDARSIDFVGYKSNHYNILARASILKRYWSKLHKILRKAKSNGGISFTDAIQLLSSNYGWLQHCDKEHFEYIMSETYKQIFNTNLMAQDILKIGLTSDEVQPTFDCIDKVKGTTLYNHHQHWIEVEQDDGTRKRMNQYDSLLVLYPVTEQHVFETLITAKYDSNYENKLLNEYNACMLGIEKQDKKKPYVDFLEDRKQLHAMVTADCAANGIPEE